MLKKILLAVVVLFGIFAAVVAMQPNDYKIQRSATMNAPVDKVFAQYNDFHNWNAWSPWAKKDPKAENAFEGEPAGKGAIFKWNGNSDVGQGMMTILESKPNELVKIKLDFQKPMESTCITDFTFKPEGEKTSVTWAMSGQSNFIGKAICLCMGGMDKMVGKDFETGLNNVKAVVEAKPTVADENTNHATK